MCFFDDDSKVYEERNIGAEREKKKGENLLYRGTCTGYIFITPILNIIIAKNLTFSSFLS